MAKWSQGDFQPKNPKKYVGTWPIRFRSSWEHTFMIKCDEHPNIIQWSSESIKINYYNPIKKRQAVYIPDFMIHYKDKNGKSHVEIIEIKPMKECIMERAKSKYDKTMVAMNHAKWEAAMIWCKRNGAKFRVMTEEQMFYRPKKNKKPRKK